MRSDNTVDYTNVVGQHVSVYLGVDLDVDLCFQLCH
jgi:hypothetical protein